MINQNAFLMRNYGHILVPGIIVLDGLALLGTGFLVSAREHGGLYATATFSVGIALVLGISIFVLPRMMRLYFGRKRHGKDADFKTVILVLVLMVLASRIAGVNGIVPAFIVGIVMGEFIITKSLFDKIHGIGHGIFIPLFFVVIGMELDIGVISRGEFSFIIPAVFLTLLLSSRVAGGMIYAALTRRQIFDGAIMGMSFWPIMSASIASTVIGLKAGIFGQEALIAVVIISIATTLPTPIILRAMTHRTGRTCESKGHTVIVGHGRTSSSLVTALKRTGRGLVVIDDKVSKVDRLEKRGITAIYGDGTDPDILHNASIETARTALITVTEGEDAIACARLIRQMNRECFIIVQVHTHADRAELSRENLADFVLWPEKLSAKIALDLVVGGRNVGSWPGTGSQIVSDPSPGISPISTGVRKPYHGTNVSDV
jgi:hypothetical protein